MFQRSEIQKGMKVLGNDGHSLGHVIDITETELIVEKRGLLRRHDFAVSLEDVDEVLHGEVILHHGQDSLFSAPREVEHVNH